MKKTLISRRGFVASGAAALAATQAHGKLALPKKPGIQFGFTTYKWGKDWDLPTLIQNCIATKSMGLELRTSMGWVHGVEPEIGAKKRAEVKALFADCPVTLLGVASGERYDSPDPAKLKAAMESTRKHIVLSHDIGATGVRVFPNDFHKDVPREKTIAQIASSLNELGKFAKDHGQLLRLEAHGSAGELPSMKAIIDQVDSPAVGIKLNSSDRDNEGLGFEHQFNLVKDRLGDTVHVHDMFSETFPNQLQIDLLVKSGWKGWMLLEQSSEVPDRVAALDKHRKQWEKMYRSALLRFGRV